MMENKKTTTSAEVYSTAEKPFFKRQSVRRCLIYIRYLLPSFTGVCLLVMSLFYSVRAAQGGQELWFSTSRLCFNTVKTARAYLIGNTVEVGKRDFYVLLLIGAVVAILCFLLAAFLAGYSATLALRAFRGEETSEETNRQKILFKVVFPNRICYFLSTLLYLVPAFFPEYFSYICTRFLEYSGGSTIIYVICNLPLIVISVLLVATLVLSIFVSRFEDEMHMNMLQIRHKSTEN